MQTQIRNYINLMVSRDCIPESHQFFIMGCTKEKSREYYLDNIERIKERVKQYRLKNPDKTKKQNKQYKLQYKLKHPDRIKKEKKEYRKKNKGKLELKAKEYYLKNREKIKNYAKKNREKIRERTREPNRLYAKKRYNNPVYRLNHNLSKAIRNSLKGKKNGKHWENLVGYTQEDLRKHLEANFKEGMNWNNYGRGGWNVDHRIPIYLFNITSAKCKGFKMCWALENLQPLWAEDNFKKSNKLFQ